MNLALLSPEDIITLARPIHVSFAEVALGGRDGDRAESLLANAKRIGTEMLSGLTETAVKRLLKSGDLYYLMGGMAGLTPGGLFNEAEMDILQTEFAKLAATAELLGRSRIRLREAHVERYAEDDPTDFSTFAEISLHPMAPLEALDYFRKLVPTIGVDAPHFGALMERQAFTMAKATSLEMAKRVQTVLAKQLAEGVNPRRAVKEIDRILDEAGVSRSNSFYSEMLVRTNFGEAYNAGSQREFSDPDLDDTFHVWKYLGIADGRERQGPLPKYADHRRWFNLYFDRHVLFADVRGREARDVIQCRCAQNPVYIRKWERLQAAGAKVTPWPK